MKLLNASTKTFIACFLEFQTVMQILTECMLESDIKSKSSTEKGILRTVWAFAGADKKQGPKTLHQHWQIWVEDINQSIKNALFDKDKNTRNKARQTLEKHIDNLISISYGPQFCVTHKCISENDQEISKTDLPEYIFKETDPECFQNARHKELYDNIRVGIMFCKSCEQTISTTDIVNQSLKR